VKSNILFILSIPPPYGGGEIVSEYLYDSIKYDYKCVTFSRKNYSKSLQQNKNYFSIIFGLFYILKIFIYIVKYRPNKIYIGLPKTFLAFLRNAILIWTISILKIDIYCELHGMGFPFINNSNRKRKFLVDTLNRTKSIRVLSRSIEKYIKNLNYKGQIFVISNGILKQNIHNKIPIFQGKLNILYLGGVTQLKGFDNVLKIMKSISNNKHSIHLNVIGEYVDKNEYDNFKNYIIQNDLFDKITFHGKIIGSDKWNLISKNHLLLHLTKFDGQPLSIIEGMSLGIPTIATRVGGIPEMIKNNNTGFLIDDINEVEHVINKIINKEIDYEQICIDVLQTFDNKYKSELMVNNILKMINK